MFLSTFFHLFLSPISCLSHNFFMFPLQFFSVSNPRIKPLFTVLKGIIWIDLEKRHFIQLSLGLILNKRKPNKTLIAKACLRCRRGHMISIRFLLENRAWIWAGSPTCSNHIMNYFCGYGSGQLVLCVFSPISFLLSISWRMNSTSFIETEVGA